MKKYLIGIVIGIVIAISFVAVSSEREADYVLQIEYDKDGPGSDLDKLYITSKEKDKDSVVSWYGDKFFSGCEEVGKELLENWVRQLEKKGIDIALTFIQREVWYVADLW